MRTLAQKLVLVGLLSATLGVASIVTVACEGQGEGERCEHENGDADCQAPLVCKRGSELGGKTDYCCPASNPTRPECIGSTNQGGGGSGGSGGAGGTGGSGGGGTGGGGTGGGTGGTGGLGGGGAGGGGAGGLGGMGGAGGN